MKYSIGELIIYGETGVCRVEDIVERPFLDSTKSCYKLTPLYSSCTIFTPVDNETVFMRPIITKDEAEALVASIPSIKPTVCNTSAPRELSDKYDKIIKSHDCASLISLSISINEKRNRLAEQKKKLSAIDERFVKKAEDLLFGELAAALNIDKASVGEYIEAKTK